MQEFKQTAGKQIRNLFIVMGSGVFGALLIAYLLVTFYSPSGMMRAGDVLLAPEIAQGLVGDVKMDRIELLYYEDIRNQWVNRRLNANAYQRVYQTVSGDQSVMEVPEKFAQETPATISLWVTNKSGETQLFQEMQIESRGEYYRILLHQDTKEPTWAYFKHKGLFSLVTKEAP